MKYYMLTTSGNTAEIYIFGDITSWEWVDSDVSSYTLSRELRELDVDEIIVHINSYGGEIAEGLAIYNMLKNHRAKVRTVVDGFACSIASVIFMAGDERVMNSASLLMVHNAWTLAAGNAAELRKQADDLDKVMEAVYAAYLEKINIGADELKRLLDGETWITPTEALDMGFATSVVSTQQQAGKAAASARKTAYQRITGAMRAPEPAHEPQANNLPPAEPEQKPERKNNVLKFFSALAQGGNVE